MPCAVYSSGMATAPTEQSKPRRAAGARGSLDPLKIAERALEIADAEGLEAVTIRRMAAESGATAMAIYWHFKDKDELLGAVADRVFADVVAPEGTSELAWDDHLKVELDAFLQAVRQHPNVTDVVLSRIFYSEPGLAMADRILGVLIGQGFSVEEAADIGTYLVCAVVTLVVAEPGPAAMLDAEAHEAEVRTKRARLLGLSPEKYPHVVAAADALSDCGSPKDYFDQGLEILVGGTAALRT